jgi:hypothetical protein
MLNAIMFPFDADSAGLVAEEDEHFWYDAEY